MKPKAFRWTPRRADLDKAMTLHRAGRVDDARRLYEQILAADPENASAWHFLGVLQHQTGHSDVGAAYVAKAIELDPRYADACNNLGNIYRETDHYDEALLAYEQAVAIAPDHADAWNNIGVIRSGFGEYAEAEKAYARAIEFNPAHAAAWQNRGTLSARINMFEAAIAPFRRAIELRPDDTVAYNGLSRALYRAGRIDEAVAVYKEWLLVDPDNAVARHMLAASTGAEAPRRASDNYVRQIFDSFAGSFEQVLDRIGYRAPTLISDFLDRNFDRSLLALRPKHEVVGVHLYDPIEKELPRSAVLECFDPESGKRFLLDAYDLKTREAYSGFANEQDAIIQKIFGKARADLLMLPSSQQAEIHLIDFLIRRQKSRVPIQLRKQ